jgi:GxxExxY protein
MKDRLNWLTQQIIGAAINVHITTGPGLLESAYEACLQFEFLAMGLRFERQKPLSLAYRGATLAGAYRMDFLVEDHVVVEVKSVERLDHVHEAQMLTYLRLSSCKVGLLINFNVKWLVEDGIKRMVNGFPD